MSTENPADQNMKIFPFHKKKVDNFLTAIALALCVLSFYDKNKIILIAFFAFTAVFLAYYVFWHKKGTTYISINEKEITALQGLFFKPVTIPLNSIQSIKMNKVYFQLLPADNSKKVTIFPILLTEKDLDRLKEVLNAKNKA
jgi:hypothetical protein